MENLEDKQNSILEFLFIYMNLKKCFFCAFLRTMLFGLLGLFIIHGVFQYHLRPPKHALELRNYQKTDVFTTTW